MELRHVDASWIGLGFFGVFRGLGFLGENAMRLLVEKCRGIISRLDLACTGLHFRIGGVSRFFGTRSVSQVPEGTFQLISVERWRSCRARGSQYFYRSVNQVEGTLQLASSERWRSCRVRGSQNLYRRQSVRGFSTGQGKDEDELKEGSNDPWSSLSDVWSEEEADEDNVPDLDPTYKPKKIRNKPKLYGFPGEEQDYSDDSESEFMDEDKCLDRVGNFSWEEYIGDSYDNAPFAERGITYEKWAELKRQLNSVSKEDMDQTDIGDEGPKVHGIPKYNNPNEHKNYRSRPKTPQQEERMRKFKEEWLKCSRIYTKQDYQPRLFSEDPHIARVKAKLAEIKPDADGRYRNLMQYVTDIDILLYAYRVVKARKLGPGTDCATIPIDNINMEWFYKTQKEMREGTYKPSETKIIYVKKKDFKRRFKKR